MSGDKGFTDDSVRSLIYLLCSGKMLTKITDFESDEIFTDGPLIGFSTQMRNDANKDFTDNNTVIYGHNLKSGLMFTSLHKFEDADFFEEHSEIYIYTPEKEYVYTIFAAYVYDDRHLLYSFDFSNPQIYANYLEDIQNMRSMNALFREGVTVTAEDKIITLSTCMNKQPNNRLLVQAVLNKDESTVQE